ncbi:MMPL family transporter [Austwickia chelonae]|uniref:MMPL family transporter n=1 Tax=Austwickia chelonae TaxID=100225 RepID=UPI000E277142|nr:MMPL family transporter [Austwickia chelonae]
MPFYLHRLGRIAACHAWAVILAWTLLLLLAGTGAATLGRPFTTKLTIPGTEFQTVIDDLEKNFPQAAAGIGAVVIRTADGKAFTTEQQKAIAELTAAWSRIDGVDTVDNPFTLQTKSDTAAVHVADGQQKISASRQQLDANQAQLDAARNKLDADQEQAAGRALPAALQEQLDAAKAAITAQQAQLDAARNEITQNENKLRHAERRLALMDGFRVVNAMQNTALTQVIFDKPLIEVTAHTKDAITAAAGDLEKAGLKVDYSTAIVEKLSIVGPGELVGLGVAALVLIVMLGSLLAAGLPLISAVVGVAVGLLGVVALTHWVDMTDVTPALALMLGLAVGIDYSLFLVNRHREQLARGTELIESIARATGTAGSAVLFAGLTVVVALCALTLTGIPFLATMGFAAAATVLIAVLIALTLTPALLRLIGPRVLSPRVRRSLADKLAAEENEAAAEDAEEKTPGHSHHRGHGWGGLVTRRPLVVLVLTTVLLSVLAAPALFLRLGLPDGSYEPRESTAYRTYDVIDRHFGPGRNGPIIAVATLGAGRVAETAGELAREELTLSVGEQLKKTPGVAHVLPIGNSEDRKTIAYQVVPATGPSDSATTELTTVLRNTRNGIIADQRLDFLGFTGQTVANIDISRSLSAALPVYLIVVVGISLLLLLLVFRSVVVPLLATAGFLLSVAAAFGSVVAVYQWGWLAGVFGIDQPGLILSFLPTLVIGILFGLAMDYQMFLVSGMREAWAHGHTARTSVHTGFSHGARVVTAAALIMAAVFASFVYAELTMIRPIGFALAAGVLIDAFIVRMTAMPAVMYLLGDKAWYLPAWLDRIIPDMDIEGSTLTEERKTDRDTSTTDTPTTRHDEKNTD